MYRTETEQRHIDGIFNAYDKAYTDRITREKNERVLSPDVQKEIKARRAIRDEKQKNFDINRMQPMTV